MANSETDTSGSQGGSDERTLAQLRADLLTAVLTGQATPPTPASGDHPSGQVLVPTPAELSRHVEVQVVVAADTLTSTHDLPASIPGVGPIDPDTARELATRQPWRRLIADPATGTLQHIDPRTLPPPTPPEPPEPLEPELVEPELVRARTS